MTGQDILVQLGEIVEARKRASPDDSYVARLLGRGEDAPLKKIGEEATEMILAAKGGDPQRLVEEMADLWFHCLVVLADNDLRPGLVLEELERRFGRSGLEEKAARLHLTE